MRKNSVSFVSNDPKDYDEKSFVLDLEGFEGPLHLLLDLSRTQKVDLRKISLIAICDQYLNFISRLKKLKIEIAADYLIMASWLVLLKSELLLPEEELNEAGCATDLAHNLKFQLLRLDAMRTAAVRLVSGNQLGRDFFKKGNEEVFSSSKEMTYTASLLDILQAYASLRTKEDFEPLHLLRSFVFSPEEALKIMNKKLGAAFDWQKLEEFVPKLWRIEPRRRRTAIATNFAICLEQARLKRFELRQTEMFAPLYLRKADNF